MDRTLPLLTALLLAAPFASPLAGAAESCDHSDIKGLLLDGTVGGVGGAFYASGSFDTGGEYDAYRIPSLSSGQVVAIHFQRTAWSDDFPVYLYPEDQGCQVLSNKYHTSIGAPGGGALTVGSTSVALPGGGEACFGGYCAPLPGGGSLSVGGLTVPVPGGGTAGAALQFAWGHYPVTSSGDHIIVVAAPSSNGGRYELAGAALPAGGNV